MSTSSVPMPSSNPPQVTIFDRVAKIPLFAYSIQQLSTTLANNAYTSSSYSAAKGLSTSAYNYAAPLQVRLAPLLHPADVAANKGLDAVQYMWPYPFQAQPEEVASYVRERRQSAVDYVAGSRQSVNKAIEERVTAPAMSAAYGVDQSLAPIVNYLESAAVGRLHTTAVTAPTDTQYQYQRVYVLSKNVAMQLYEYSNQTSIVQTASQTAHNAHSRIDAISTSLICELQRVQASIADSTSAASRELGNTITTLRSIITTPDLPLKDKASTIGAELHWRILPIMEKLLGAKKEPTPENQTNGHPE